MIIREPRAESTTRLGVRPIREDEEKFDQAQERKDLRPFHHRVLSVERNELLRRSGARYARMLRVTRLNIYLPA